MMKSSASSSTLDFESKDPLKTEDCSSKSASIGQENEIFERYSCLCVSQKSQSSSHSKHNFHFKNKERCPSIISFGGYGSNHPCLCCSPDDFIAPVLDTTTEVLSDPELDMNEVTIVYCHSPSEKTIVHSFKQSDNKFNTKDKEHHRSRSIISERLMKALDIDEDPLEPDLAQSVDICEAGSPTINYYSFADILERENEAESFKPRRMSDIIP